ncbi:MAG: hypothetical protein ACOC9B_01680 [Chloroflexota bacterium]
MRYFNRSTITFYPGIYLSLSACMDTISPDRPRPGATHGALMSVRNPGATMQTTTRVPVLMCLAVLLGYMPCYSFIAVSGYYVQAASRRSRTLGLQSVAGFWLTVVEPLVFGNLLEASNGADINPMAATSRGIPFIVPGFGAILAPLAALALSRLPESKLPAREEP